MGFDKAYQNLSDLEDRLRRWLRLAGEIGASFLPEMRPVVVAGDLRDPGVHDFRGRQFVWAWQPAVPLASPADEIVVLFAVDVLIDCVKLLGAQTNDCGIVAVPPAGPGTAANLGVAVTRPAGVWNELRISATDAPPIMDSGGATVNTNVAPSHLNQVMSWAGSPGTHERNEDVRWHLPAFSQLVFIRLGVGGTMQPMIEGRIF